MRGALLAAVLLVVGRVAVAAELPFSVDFSLELPGQTSLSLGAGAGSLVRETGNQLVFPAVGLVPASASFAPAGASCVSGLQVRQDGFGGGTLAPTATGFGGPLPLSGSLVADVLAGTLGSLGVPLSLGISASPATRAYSLSPATSAPPVEGFLSLSYSRWNTAVARMTGTHDGAVTTWQVGGSLLSTLAGAQEISLVSPMHLYFADIDAGGTSSRRTIPVAGRMRITVPAPPVLLSEVVGVVTLAGLAWRRWKHR